MIIKFSLTSMEGIAKNAFNLACNDELRFEIQTGKRLINQVTYLRRIIFGMKGAIGFLDGGDRLQVFIGGDLSV